MPNRTTDGHKINGKVHVIVCRRDATTGPCPDVGEVVLAPNVEGAFSELLPEALSSGVPRPLYYSLKLENSYGRSTGLTTGVVTVAGTAPSPIRGLTVTMKDHFAELCWMPANIESEQNDVIRIHRTVLPELEDQHRASGVPKSAPPSQGKSIEADSLSLCAVDNDIRVGEQYEYRAQRVAQVTVDGHIIELPGFLSDPIRSQALTAPSP